MRARSMWIPVNRWTKMSTQEWSWRSRSSGEQVVCQLAVPTPNKSLAVPSWLWFMPGLRCGNPSFLDWNVTGRDNHKVTVRMPKTIAFYFYTCRVILINKKFALQAIVNVENKTGVANSTCNIWKNVHAFQSIVSCRELPKEGRPLHAVVIQTEEGKYIMFEISTCLTIDLPVHPSLFQS